VSVNVCQSLRLFWPGDGPYTYLLFWPGGLGIR